MFVSSIEKVQEETITEKGAEGITVKWLLEKSSGVPFEMRYFEMKKGGSCPVHTHDDFFHEVFIVKGRGIFVGEDTELEVKPGDAVYIPPRESHGIRNPYDEPFGYICLVPQGREDHIKYRSNYGSEAT